MNPEQTPAERLAELKAQLRELKEARRSGVKRIIFNERDITYKSDDDMRQAQRELEEEIATTTVRRRRRSRMVLTTFRSGY